MAVFPGSFAAPAAAAVWKLEAEAAGETLGGLLDYSLLEYDAKSGRYRLHDLARAFAVEVLPPEEEDGARLRHAEHYLNVLSAADELYLQGGERVLEGLALFDLELENLRAGQAWAASQAGRDEAAARLCSRYPDAGIYCLDLRLHSREQITWLEAGLAAARTLGDRSLQGAALGNLGLAYAALGQPGKAIEYYQQHLEIAREIGDRRGEGNALGNLGVAYKDLGQPGVAIEFYQRQLEITREIGDRRGEGAALGNLGLAYADLGRPEKAIEYHEQDLEVAREISDRRGEGAALGNLGNAYAALGRPGVAIEFYRQHLEIAREVGDRRGEAIGSWNLGDEYRKQGKLDEALSLMEVTLEYERSIGHADYEKDRQYVAALRAGGAKDKD